MVVAAQATPSPALLVLSKQDHTVAIVDPATLQVVARAPVGDDPHEVAASSDGRTAYVSNYGFGAFHTITVIDLVNQKQEKVIDLTPLRGPHGLDFVDGKLWFTAEANKVIGRYDPASGKVDWIMGTGQNRTHMLYVFPGAKRIVTTNVNSGTVSILDFEKSQGGPPPGGPGARPAWWSWRSSAGISPRSHPPARRRLESDGRHCRLGRRGLRRFSRRQGSLGCQRRRWHRLHRRSRRQARYRHIAAQVQSANRLKFTPDGKRVLISMLGQG